MSPSRFGSAGVTRRSGGAGASTAAARCLAIARRSSSATVPSRSARLPGAGFGSRRSTLSSATSNASLRWDSAFGRKRSPWRVPVVDRLVDSRSLFQSLVDLQWLAVHGELDLRFVASATEEEDSASGADLQLVLLELGEREDGRPFLAEDLRSHR